MSRVWEHSQATGSALLILLAVADFANDEGSAYPAIKTLATKARMSERNARYVIGKLVDIGELKVQQNAGPRGCNLFHVTTSVLVGVQLAQGAKIAGMQSVPPAMGFPGGVQPASEGAAIAIAPEPSLTVIELSRSNRSRREKRATLADPRFDRFWQAYPKKVAKPDAENAWSKLRPDELLAELICKAVAAQVNSESWGQDDGRFIPYPATWLNGRRWEDEMAPGAPIRASGAVARAFW